MSPARSMLRLAHGASLTILCAGIIGCNFGSAEVLTPVNVCGGDEDCVQGVCDDRICVDDSAREVAIAVEVLRGSSDTQGATPASWAFVPESFSRASERDYTLPLTRQVIGVVRWQGTPVPARLRFTRRMDPLLSALSAVPVEVDTLREPSEGDDPGDVDFSALLVSGESYDVVIVPSSDVLETADQAAAAIRSLPPIYRSIELDDVIDGTPFRFDVTFPEALDEECPENQLVGCTLIGTVLFDDESETPAVGLQVRAIEKASGRVVSSIGETGGSGDFAIRVGDDAAPYTIRISSSVGSAPFPSVSVDPDLAFDDPAERSIRVPRVDGAQFTGSVRGEEGQPVQGATVRFSSNDIFEGTSELGLEGSFSASTTTSDDGSFNIELLPGLYTVTVTPPEDAENAWASLSAEAPVVEVVAELEDLVLPSQIALFGSCTTFTGDPASGVTVLARARGDMGELQRSRETASSQEGEFRLSIDAGRYDMLVKIADARGFPWLVEPELVMSAERGDIMRDYTLPPPIVVRGMLQAAGGTIVTGAQIRAYVFESDGDEVRPIQVAETVSADDGSYQLLISPTLAER